MIRGQGEWIQSASYDLGFFTLSPLLGLGVLLMAPTGPSWAVVLVGTVLAIPHYMSTYTFYFWDENRAYHRKRWIAFFLGPALVVLALTALMAAGRMDFLLFALYSWNAFHIARQSCGVLSIYRHRGGVTANEHKTLANNAILAAAGCCALWNFRWDTPVNRFLSSLIPDLPRLLWIAFAAAAVLALARLGFSFVQRRQEGQPPRLPEIGCLVSSLLLFLPYLWIRDWDRATFGILTGHFVQYLGLVWLVHRRRFRDQSGSRGQRWLARVSGDLRILAACCVASGVAFMLLQRVLSRLPWPTAYTWVAGTVSFLHFYLDGLFWAFKRPQVRRTLGPYLASGPSPVTAPPVVYGVS